MIPLSSQRGNALIAILVSTGLLGAVAYFSSQSFVSRTKVGRGLDSLSDFSGVMDRLQGVLSNPLACQQNFAGKLLKSDNVDFQITPSFDPLTFEIDIPGLNGKPGTKIAKVSDAIGDLTLTEMKLTLQGQVGTTGNFFAALSLKAERGTSNQTRASGVSQRTRQIILSIESVPTTNANEYLITKCTAMAAGTTDFSILSVSPSVGPVLGGTLLTVLGTGFDSSTKLILGNLDCTSVSIVSAVQLTCITPAHASGAVDVIAKSGSLTASLPQAFTYGGVDKWTPMSTTGAPSARLRACTVWTGSEMIVVGGDFGSPYAAQVPHAPLYSSGGSYNPTTDKWTSIPDAPSQIDCPYPYGVWTGSKALFFNSTSGSYSVYGGLAYTPATKTWNKLAHIPDSVYPGYHDIVVQDEIAVIWNGSQAVIYGGTIPYYPLSGSPIGAIVYYDPTLDPNLDPTLPASSVPWSSPGSSSPRKDHQMFWTGSQIIAFGGTRADGFISDSALTNSQLIWNLPGACSFATPNTCNTPGPAAFTGSELVSMDSPPWHYNVAADSWAKGVSPPPGGGGGVGAKAVWTGSEILFKGGVYNPNTKSWRLMSTVNAAEGTYADANTAVWTGSEVIVWGGAKDDGFCSSGCFPPRENYHAVNTGARYMP